MAVSEAVVPSATLTPRAKTADGPPRLKQRAIAPARLGHSIRIDKTGLEDGQRSSTRPVANVVAVGVVGPSRPSLRRLCGGPKYTCFAAILAFQSALS